MKQEDENKDINDTLEDIKWHVAQIAFHKEMILEEEKSIERLNNLVAELMGAKNE